MASLKAQAIQTALVGDWMNAITLNRQILDGEPNDIDTLNRLAFAFLSLGHTKDAKNLYEKVLSLDMKNPIALRNLQRLNNNKTLRPSIQLNNLFIEEPGKTKIIELLNVADKKILAPLRCGEELRLRIKRNKLFVLDLQNHYTGMLPDDIGQRLIRFIKGGNIYSAYVKTVANNYVSIFIREEKQVKRYLHQPSFVATDSRAKLMRLEKNQTLTIGKHESSKSREKNAPHHR